MKREARYLLKKATSSLTLSIEMFNRPIDVGRVDSVLIFLNHSFEMLLKAAITQMGGKIRRPREKQTMRHDDCIRKALSDSSVKFLDEDQALTLQTINTLRDSAQHYLLDLSEQQLYLYAQAGLTLFRDLYQSVFKLNLHNLLPVRVLPISTKPPSDIATIFDQEVEEVSQLIKPGKRQGIEVRSKLRPLVIVEDSLHGESLQPSPSRLNKLIQEIKKGKNWKDLFPGIASLILTTKGYGPSLDLRISTKKGIPVVLVPEGTPGASVVAIKRVNELSFYSLSRSKVATKLGLTAPRTTALIEYSSIRDDPECFKEFKIGKVKHKRYSLKTVDQLKEVLKRSDINKIWRQYMRKVRNRRKKVE